VGTERIEEWKLGEKQLRWALAWKGWMYKTPDRTWKWAAPTPGPTPDEDDAGIICAPRDGQTREQAEAAKKKRNSAVAAKRVKAAAPAVAPSRPMSGDGGRRGRGAGGASARDGAFDDALNASGMTTRKRGSGEAR